MSLFLSVAFCRLVAVFFFWRGTAWFLWSLSLSPWHLSLVASPAAAAAAAAVAAAAAAAALVGACAPDDDLGALTD